jgi:3-oxoacyl-[acyl-carrier-protein] synthase III
MPFFKFEKIKIAGIATAVPTKKVSVKSFAPEFGDAAVDSFTKMTGIIEYRKARPEQTASDLGFVAAENLISNLNIDISKIGALIFVSHSPDYRRPATAFVLHKRLGLSKECIAYDISLGCSAFVVGLQDVCALMTSSDIDSALLICAETISKIVYPKDKSVAMLFGDGGSAVYLKKDAAAAPIHGLVRSDGQGYKAVIAPAGGFRNLDATREPILWPDGNERTLYNTNMNGTDVFGFTISDVPLAINDFLTKSANNIEDYDAVVLHQANQFIHKKIAKKIGCSTDKMPLSLDRFGNTSAPAIPLTICDAFGGEPSKMIKLLNCGFGVGLSWGVVDFEIDTDLILPIVESDDFFAQGVINSPEDYLKV